MFLLNPAFSQVQARAEFGDCQPGDGSGRPEEESVGQAPGRRDGRRLDGGKKILLISISR